MTEWILLGLLLGTDNLLAATGLGLLDMGPRQRRRLLLGFVVFEALMPVLGFALGSQALGWVAPIDEGAALACLGLAGVLGLLGAFGLPRAKAALAHPLAAILIPFLLSLDNLAAGLASAGTGGASLLTAAFLGAVSAGLCALGLLSTQALRKRSPRKAQVAGSLWLSGLALLSLTGTLS